MLFFFLIKIFLDLFSTILVFSPRDVTFWQRKANLGLVFSLRLFSKLMFLKLYTPYVYSLERHDKALKGRRLNGRNVQWDIRNGSEPSDATKSER